MNPAYVWGAASLLPGAPGDCSGKIYAIFFSCGVLVTRGESRLIADAWDGWKFDKVMYDEMKRLAIVFMTMPPSPGKQKRLRGHMGIIIKVEVQNGETVYLMANAQLSAGFVVVWVKKDTWPFRYFDWARQTAP